MARKDTITMLASDVHTRVVGSLKGFQNKRKRANDPSFAAAEARAARQPTTLRALLGIPEGYTDNEGTGHLVYGSMSAAFAISDGGRLTDGGLSPMRLACGV